MGKKKFITILIIALILLSLFLFYKDSRNSSHKYENSNIKEDLALGAVEKSFVKWKDLLSGILDFSLLNSLDIPFYFPDWDNSILKLKCPDDYNTTEEREDALRKFFKNFEKENPNILEKEWEEKWPDARKQFFIEKKCEKALARLDIYLSGNADWNFPELVNGSFESYLGFSFQYSWGYIAMPFSNNQEDLAIIPIIEDISEVYSGETRQDKDSFVIIAIRENPQGATAMDWLKSEYSGYNFSNGYQEKQIGGVNGYLLYWRDPKQIDGALFVSPDGKLRITITTLGNTKILEEEFNKIIDTFSFL